MDRLTRTLDAAGLAFLVVAAFLLHLALGFAATGIALIVYSWRLAP